MTLGGPSASLGFCLLILSLDGYQIFDNWCYDCEKLEVQRGSVDEEGQQGWGPPDSKAGLPAAAT